jgi:CRISPR/Cas system-associated endonuclease/helicase Cas3
LKTQFSINLGDRAVQAILEGKYPPPDHLTEQQILRIGKSCGKTRMTAAMVYMYFKKKYPEQMRDIEFSDWF